MIVTKIDIAEQQLTEAIELFCVNKPIPAITLAGAAEEILGKLVKESGNTNALERAVKERCDVFQEIYTEPGNEKEFINIMNQPRNELKHLMSGTPLDIDLEQKAVELIRRAIDNFQKIDSSYKAAFRKFDDYAAAWYRRSNAPKI